MMPKESTPTRNKHNTQGRIVARLEIIRRIPTNLNSSQASTRKETMSRITGCNCLFWAARITSRLARIGTDILPPRPEKHEGDEERLEVSQCYGAPNFI